MTVRKYQFCCRTNGRMCKSISFNKRTVRTSQISNKRPYMIFKNIKRFNCLNTFCIFVSFPGIFLGNITVHRIYKKTERPANHTFYVKSMACLRNIKITFHDLPHGPCTSNMQIIPFNKNIISIYKFLKSFPPRFHVSCRQIFTSAVPYVFRPLYTDRSPYICNMVLKKCVGRMKDTAFCMKSQISLQRLIRQNDTVCITESNKKTSGQLRPEPCQFR